MLEELMEGGAGRRMSAKVAKRRGPVWQGPEKDGITFSLLSRFLCCRERFRLMVVEGLKPRDGFSARMEFGNCWHVCEEKHAAKEDWARALRMYCDVLGKQYPFDREQITHWQSVVLSLFPVYVQHWARHPDVTDRTPLLQEQTFDVAYSLPSGRIVRLRGKWDSVDLIGKGKDAGVYIQENKTKSQIDAAKVQRQLSFDLQTMMYIVALERWWDAEKKATRAPDAWLRKEPIRGVRYNVVRRSAHKTAASMMKKVEEDVANGRSGEWFARWKVEISQQDVAKFRRQCLDPVLEQLCDWWQWVKDCQDPDKLFCIPEEDYNPKGVHFRFPYGVYNPLLEGASSDLDGYLETGSEVGLQRVDDLFPELK